MLIWCKDLTEANGLNARNYIFCSGWFFIGWYNSASNQLNLISVAVMARGKHSFHGNHPSNKNAARVSTGQRC